MYLPNEVHANKLTLRSELMIFIGYKDNSYRFIRHTQGNVIFHSTQAIFNEGHFPRCLLSHPREQTPPGRLIPEIELSVPRPSGVDEPAPSPSPPLIPPKWSSVKIEEVEDVEDEDVEMHSPSPSSPEAGPSQYTPPQVPTVIPQK